MGADLLELAEPDIADVVTGGNNFKTTARIVGKQTLRKQLGSGSRKKSASRVIATKSAKQASLTTKDLFTNNSP